MINRKRNDSLKTTEPSGRRAAWSSLTDIAHDPQVRFALENDAKLRVAENVIRLRKKRSMTQDELARKAGLTQGKIARIEGGDENITLRTLERLVAALGGRLQLNIEDGLGSRARLAS